MKLSFFILFVHTLKHVVHFIICRFRLIIGVKQPGIGGIIRLIMVNQTKYCNIGNIGRSTALQIFISQHKENTPSIEAVIFGKIMDFGIKDANNMGAAMAPAAAETIQNFLTDTNTQPSDYDLILTGDLGKVGSDLLIDLLIKDFNIDISSVHNDCGLMIYDLEEQDMHAGGSGCGCSASVVNSFIMNRLKNGELKNVLFVGTGALLSTTSSLQGESVPGIAHGVLLTNGE